MLLRRIQNECATGRKWMRKPIFIVSLCVTLAAVLAAMFFSSQGSTASNALSKELLYKIMELFQIEITTASVKQGNFLIRKAAHFLLYFILGMGLTTTLQFQRKLPAWLPAFVLGAVFAATDEFHQSFTGRTAMVKDVVLDSCGVAVGCFVAWQLWKKWGKDCG